jgi:hypothetical protein
VQDCDFIALALRLQPPCIVLWEFCNHLKPFEAGNNPFTSQGILRTVIVFQNRKSLSDRKVPNNSSSAGRVDDRFRWLILAEDSFSQIFWRCVLIQCSESMFFKER